MLLKKELSQMQFLLKQKENLNKSLGLLGLLYDHQLQAMYPNWVGRNYLSLEQKEFFVMAEEYYGKKNYACRFFQTHQENTLKMNKLKLFPLFIKLVTVILTLEINLLSS
ncbi:hypothetical protein RCO48_08350 [Peribacillus frigoritolerans]|nr:hypothetical protein [Peribacillus frigoritolerans]